jgi:hypothetical protein
MKDWKGYTPESLRAAMPVKKGKRKDESKLQKAVKDLHRLMFPEDWVVIRRVIKKRNGKTEIEEKTISMLYSNYTNAHSAHGGAIADAQGRSSGVADLTWICPDNRTIHIELKTEIGRQSKAQKQWQKMVESRGHTYHLIRSLAEFQALCEGERNKRAKVYTP